MINRLLHKTKALLYPFCHRRVLGIDIGSDSIKLAEGVLENGKMMLSQVHVEQRIDHANVASLTVQMLANNLIHALQVGGMRAKQVIASLPYDKVLSREMFLPITDNQELEEAVYWEVEKLSPFNNNYYYDFVVIDNLEDGKRILLIVAERSAVDYLVNTFAAASLKLIAVESLPIALGRISGDADGYMIIDIGWQSTRVTIYRGELPVNSNVITIGGEDFTAALQLSFNISYDMAEQLKKYPKKAGNNGLERVDKENLTENFVKLEKQLSKEIMRIYEYYKIQSRNHIIKKVFLCGGGALLADLAKNLEREVKMPVQLLNVALPLECIDSLDKTVVLHSLPQTAAAIGMVMRGN